MKRRVVITGLGAITAVGRGAGVLWESTIAQRSAIDRIASFSVGDFPVRIAGEIRDFDPEAYIPRKTLKVMARDIQLAVAASRLAIEDAQLDLERVDPERIGINMGSGLLSYELEELAPPIAASLDGDGSFTLDRFGSEGLGLLFPLWLLKYLPNMSACHCSILLNLQGPSNTITTACASSTQAIGEAFRIIERGSADLMLAGGAEAKVNPIGLTRYQLLGILTKRHHQPKMAYRPFDLDRDGMVVGEGAGIVLLEELGHARRRRAKIYAELIGYGSAPSLGQTPSQPQDEQGFVLAMERALKDAQRSGEAMGYVHAHGLGTSQGDALEAKAIHQVCGTTAIPVVATKPIIGYAGFAAGVLDVIIATLSLAHQRLVATMNCDQPDSSLPIRVNRVTRTTAMRSVLVNSFGLGGVNACLVLQRQG